MILDLDLTHPNWRETMTDEEILAEIRKYHPDEAEAQYVLSVLKNEAGDPIP